MKLRLLLSVLAVLALGCANPNPNQGQNVAIGAMTGAAAGALMGDNTESIATGAIVGGLIGSQVH